MHMLDIAHPVVLNALFDAPHNLCELLVGGMLVGVLRGYTEHRREAVGDTEKLLHMTYLSPKSKLPLGEH